MRNEPILKTTMLDSQSRDCVVIQNISSQTRFADSGTNITW